MGQSNIHVYELDLFLECQHTASRWTFHLKDTTNGGVRVRNQKELDASGPG